MPNIGGAVARRPIHFIFIIDTSGSMTGQKVAALNEAINEAIPHMRSVAEQNPFAELLIRAVAFSSGARWLIANPMPVDQFVWMSVDAGGVTDLGHALKLVAAEMTVERMGSRALPPVLVLISDGQPTDDFEGGLAMLMHEPWAKKAVRLSIAIGNDADHSTLTSFIGNSEIPVLQANNPEQLVASIKWASTVVVEASMRPSSQSATRETTGNVPVPLPVTPDQAITEAHDVF